MGRAAPYKIAALSIAGHRLHRLLQRRHHLAGPEDRLPRRRHPPRQQIAILVGTISSALVIGLILLSLNSASTVYAKRDCPGFTADVSALPEMQHLRGPDAAHDAAEYHVLRLPEPKSGVPAGQVPGRRQRAGSSTSSTPASTGALTPATAARRCRSTTPPRPCSCRSSSTAS